MLRILVVEDDALLGLVLVEMLEAAGHSVCALETSQAGAVAAEARFRPDLMLVDARLNPGSGLAAVTEILQTRFVPHIFMSGNIARVRDAFPRSEVLEKPFSETILMTSIKDYLERLLPV